MLSWQIAKNIGIYFDARDNLRNAKREFRMIENEKYPDPDPEPKLEVIRGPIYPPVKTNVRYPMFALIAGAATVVGGVLFTMLRFAIIFGGGRGQRLVDLSNISHILQIVGYSIIAIAVCVYCVRSKSAANSVRNSAEYKSACRNAELEYAKQCEAAKIRYQAALKEYNETYLPKYKKAQAAWLVDKCSRAFRADLVVRDARDKFNESCSGISMIPDQYMDDDALEYLENFLWSSDVELSDALASYDAHRQRQLDQQAIDIANKQRRDANIAATVATIQRHKIYKELKRRD
jgi:hypothetical protein